MYREKSLIIRSKARDEGIKYAKLAETLHMKACMLYWAEGSKNSSAVQFTNTDIFMHRIILDFLKKYFPDLKVKAALNYYSTGDKNYEEIVQYWCKGLDLTEDQFNKPAKREKYYQPKKIIKNPYGILRIQTGSVKCLHHIYGSITFYAGMDKDTFLYIGLKEI